MRQSVSQNSSPVLPAFPPIYACIGTPFVIEQGGTDADGDELRYRLNTPNIGATQADPYPANPSAPPYDPVTWETGYSLPNLMGTTIGLTIDPVTGQISVTPDDEGQFLVSFCVEEYRSDRLFNTTCREFEVNTRPCGDPAFAMITPRDATICDDKEIDFSSAGSDGDVFEWDFGDGQTSTDPNPTNTYPDSNGCYTVVLRVTNSASDCYDIDSIELCLYNSGVIENDFAIDMSECVDSVVVTVSDQNTYDVTNPVVSIDWDVTVGAIPVVSDTGSMILYIQPPD